MDESRFFVCIEGTRSVATSLLLTIIKGHLSCYAAVGDWGCCYVRIVLGSLAAVCISVGDQCISLLNCMTSLFIHW